MMREALPVSALLLLATLLCPAVAMSGAIIHVRLPAVACILFLRPPACADPRWVRPALALLAVAIGLGGVEWLRWRAGDAVIAAIRAAAEAHIETGARVATALATTDDFALAHGRRSDGARPQGLRAVVLHHQGPIHDHRPRRL